MDILPPDIRNTEQAKQLYEYGCVTEMDIVQLIYRPHEPQGACKDYEFSRVTMNERWEQGLSDARTTLAAAPWLAPIPKDVGVRVFDVMHDILDPQTFADDGHAHTDRSQWKNPRWKRSPKKENERDD